MPRSIVAGAISVLLVIQGCDPILALKVRQTLNTAPSSDCMNGALSRSTLVAHADRPYVDDRGISVTLQDPAGVHHWPARVIRQPALGASSSQVADVTIAFPYLAADTPGAEDRQSLVAVADSLLEEIRRSCGGVPTDSNCTYELLGSWRIRSKSCR